MTFGHIANTISMDSIGLSGGSSIPNIGKAPDKIISVYLTDTNGASLLNCKYFILNINMIRISSSNAKYTAFPANNTVIGTPGQSLSLTCLYLYNDTKTIYSLTTSSISTSNNIIKMDSTSEYLYGGLMLYL